MSILAQRFRLEREIGSGGMARVYLGTDEVLGRPVAVKILKTGFDDEEVSDRFQREGRTAARLSHQNIVQVYDAGEGDLEGREVSYIVMEYVPGGDLKQFIDERGPLPGREIARIGSEVAAGLAHAHDRGVVHRDVKPHNILLDDYGNPKLTDFGIARALDSAQATQTGFYLGTALYSSPEQLQGERATPRSDVYSLGVTLYQAATGETPFSGATVEVASQHTSKEPVPPGRIEPSLDTRLEDLILSCLAKDPRSRPDAARVRETLSRSGGSSATRAPTPPTTGDAEMTRRTRQASARASEQTVRVQRRGKSRIGAVIFAVLALVAVIGVVAAATLLTNEGNPPVANQGSRDPANPPSNETPPENAGRQQTEETPSEGQPSAQPSAQPVSRQTGSGGTEDLSEEAASRTVEEMYVSAARGDYETSYDALSDGFQQTTTPAAWAGTFTTLESIRFVEGPEATVSGDTATVTGTTIANHTNRTETNVGTWTLVNEGGSWKVSDYTVQSA